MLEVIIVTRVLAKEIGAQSFLASGLTPTVLTPLASDPHAGQHRIGHAHNTEEVGPKYRRCLFDRGFLSESPLIQYACVVDEDINSCCPVQHFLNSSLDTRVAPSIQFMHLDSVFVLDLLATCAEEEEPSSTNS